MRDHSSLPKPARNCGGGFRGRNLPSTTKRAAESGQNSHSKTNANVLTATTNNDGATCSIESTNNLIQAQVPAKRRSTFGSRFSIQTLFFPAAYSTSIAGAALPAQSKTSSTYAEAPPDAAADPARSKMSRSTNDLQNSSVESTTITNKPATADAHRSSMEKLLANDSKTRDASSDRVVVVIEKPGSYAHRLNELGVSSGSDQDRDRDSVANLSTTSASGTHPQTKGKMRECPLCFTKQPSAGFPHLSYCHHRSCHSCLVQYLRMEILESRVNVTCPECSEPMHPNDIYKILSVDDNSMLSHKNLIEKYEEFSVRRVLMTDPDTRWCPAPDCSYAVVATGCAACPELKCQRPGCKTLFCYHCKMVWHPNQTCDEARAQRGSFATSPIHIDTTIRPGDIKACPRCRTYIVKMNDGSCNHMICALCGAEFCWLCLKEISDLHYLSPSGCTFWGKKPWSRKKKLIWQLGMLVGAPVGIALVAGLAVPAIIFGVPVWVGRKVHQKMKDTSKAKRRLAIAGGIIGSVLMSPVLASMAVGVGVPIMLAYVYGVVPLSLCRNGSCGVTASSSGVRLDLDDDILAMTGGSDGLVTHEKSQLLKDVDKHDTSTVTGFSMQSGSTQHKMQIQADVCSTGTGMMLIGGLSAANQRRPSIESTATASLCGERCYINYEEASTKALAGSTYCDDKSVHTVGSLLESSTYYTEPDQASIKGFARSVGGHADTKSAKSFGSGAIGVDNASTRAMAGSICGVVFESTSGTGQTVSSVATDTGDCGRCGGRKSSSSLRTQNHPHYHFHVHIDDSYGGDADRQKRCSVSATVPEPTDESALLERLDDTVTEEDPQKCKEDVPKMTLGPNSRQSIEKSSSLRRFLFLRSGGTSDEAKRKRLTLDSDQLDCINTKSTQFAASTDKRCRFHRDECQCDDAEFLLLPSDALIIHRQKPARRPSVSIKKSRSWSALLLEGGPPQSSSMAAELWSTVRGAFSGATNDPDPEIGYRRYEPSHRNISTTGAGLAQRLRPGRRATVGTATAVSAKLGKKVATLDATASYTSLPETYCLEPVPSTRVSGESRECGHSRTLMDKSQQHSSTNVGNVNNKRLSTTLANFFKLNNDKLTT